mgnify:CR=1 FL=1
MTNLSDAVDITLNNDSESMTDDNSKFKIEYLAGKVVKGWKVNDASIKKCVDNKEEHLIINGFPRQNVLETLDIFNWVRHLEIKNIFQMKSIPAKLPAELQKLTIINCDIVVFNGAFLPKSLKEIVFDGNRVVRVSNINEGVEKISFRNNNIMTQFDIPLTLEELDVSGNQQLNTIPNMKINYNLKKINLSKTGITSADLSRLPESLETLVIEHMNRVRDITYLPSELKHLEAQGSKIRSIDALPKGIETLDLYNNDLMSLPIIGENIKFIQIGYNNFKTLPMVSKSAKNLEKFIFNNNRRLKVTQDMIDELKETYSNVDLDEELLNIVSNDDEFDNNISDDINNDNTKKDDTTNTMTGSFQSQGHRLGTHADYQHQTSQSRMYNGQNDMGYPPNWPKYQNPPNYQQSAQNHYVPLYQQQTQTNHTPYDNTSSNSASNPYYIVHKRTYEL